MEEAKEIKIFIRELGKTKLKYENKVQCNET